MRRTPFTWMLATAAIGVYALILAGATTALTDAAASCQSWPSCHGDWFVLTGPDLVLVWIHRLLAALVGLLIAGLAVGIWRTDVEPRVRWAVTTAAIAYPIQVVIGARTAITPTSTPVAALHLGVGIGILAALIAALAWSLEDFTSARHRGSDANAPRAEDAGSQAGTTTGDGWVPATLLAYVRLMKPRLMWLLCLVAGAGMALAAGSALALETVVLTLGGGVLAIGASGTFNHVLERDRDRAMARTADRPVVQDRIPVRNAVVFGVTLTGLSLVVFLQVNLLAAALGMAAILYYAVVYTLLLKPNTVQNTVVGGFAGALPALIGVAAVTGTIDIAGVVLASVVFLWTPAHFYNLALAYREDYERGGFPMLPVVRGRAVTRKHILYYLGATFAATAALGWVTGLGVVYAGTASVVGAVFLWAVVRLHHEQDRQAAFRAFHASNIYLGAVLIAVLGDALVV